MRRSLTLTGLALMLCLLTTSCDQQQAVDKLMENDIIVNNIMEKMWQDPALKAKLMEKFMADQESYTRVIDTTLGNSTMFSALMQKVAENDSLKKQVISLADAWKKEAAKKK
jgi:F0F1-type ATP synthase membrane subunit c/vacuolar-type H+-ATPase subunit K